MVFHVALHPAIHLSAIVAVDEIQGKDTLRILLQNDISDDETQKTHTHMTYTHFLKCTNISNIHNILYYINYILYIIYYVLYIIYYVYIYQI